MNRVKNKQWHIKEFEMKENYAETDLMRTQYVRKHQKCCKRYIHMCMHFC